MSLENFENILKHSNKKNIFSLIFPEFKYLERLERLYKLKKIIKINQNILLPTLIVGETNNHEYFAYKYNISNEIKKELELFNKTFALSSRNINFFEKDLEKNIYLYGKNHLILLNALIFTTNSKFKIDSFLKVNKIILQTKIQKFPFDGNFLMKNGMKEGSALGKVLKMIEDEWIINGFKISKDRVKEIIKSN